MSSDKKKNLEHIEPKKKEIGISEDDKKILEKYSGIDDRKLTSEEATVLEMLTKRKNLEMIFIEYNLMLESLGKEIIRKERLREILESLKEKKLVKSVTGADGKIYWVDINYL
jgi:hypothetical protein